MNIQNFDMSTHRHGTFDRIRCVEKVCVTHLGVGDGSGRLLLAEALNALRRRRHDC